ncbi:MAG: head decoration protein [Variovorax sp.]|nr:head decoration protein [Variovorax sp.]
MALTVNSVGDNPQQPGIYAEAFIPDQLIAGNLKLVTGNGTLGTGALKRGAVLGQQTGTVTQANPTNVGNGTLGSITKGAAIRPGVYTLRATSATNFTVAGPDGAAMPNATVGTPYVSADLNFTLTAGGTAFAAGDAFNINVPGGNYILSVATASDGSEVPVAILADDADASGGAVAIGVYLMGEFNQNAILPDASWGANAAAWTPLLSNPLRNVGIFLKSSVTAADPT